MTDAARNEALFLQLVAMFQFAAMQQMGKIANPVTNQIDRDLAQARYSIDMVEMLHARTEGKRSRDESEFLEKVLFELRMNYLDEMKRAPDAEPGAGSSEPLSPGDANDAR